MKAIFLLGLVALPGSLAFMPHGGMPTSGKPSLRQVSSQRRQAPVALRMGLFDGLSQAFQKGMQVPNTGAGSADIDEEGMRGFTFDERPTAPIPGIGTYTLAGQKAPKGAAVAPVRSQGWSPFGFLQNAGGNAAPKRKDKENQDGIIMAPDLYDGVSLFCVFDGHGENGAIISQWCEERMPAYMAQALSQGRAGELLNRITDAYRQADVDLQEQYGYSFVEDSGTTVATVLIKGDLLLVAGLGDSRVVMGLEEEGSLGAQALTLDQSPSVAAEKRRIEAAGGEVRGEGLGGRVYAAGQQFPGLAVSRAFGDADGKKIGVTVDPQFIGWKIRPENDWCIVAASDGVWNAIGNENVIEICSKYREAKDANNAAREVVETARKVWEAVAKGRIDDITAIVLFL